MQTNVNLADWLESFVFIFFSPVISKLNMHTLYIIYIHREQRKTLKKMYHNGSHSDLYKPWAVNRRKCTSFLYCKQLILVELMIGLCFYPTLKTLLFQGKADVNKYMFLCLLVYLTLSGVSRALVVRLHCLSSHQNIINKEI